MPIYLRPYIAIQLQWLALNLLTFLLRLYSENFPINVDQISKIRYISNWVLVHSLQHTHIGGYYIFLFKGALWTFHDFDKAKWKNKMKINWNARGTYVRKKEIYVNFQAEPLTLLMLAFGNQVYNAYSQSFSLSLWHCLPCQRSFSMYCNTFWGCILGSRIHKTFSSELRVCHTGA